MRVREGEGTPPRIAALVRRYQVMRDRAAKSPWLLPVGALLVIVGIAWSWTRLDLSQREIDRGALVASALLSIPGALLSAVEFRLAQRLAGGDASFRTSVHVSLLGSLANLLPLPGGAMVRVEAMRNSGSKLSTAVRMTMAIGLTWLGLALLGSGAAILTLDRPLAGVALVGLGSAVAVAGIVTIRPRDSRAAWLSALVVATELLVVAIAVARIHLVLNAIGENPTWAQSLGLVASGAVAVAIGLVPAGLGIRELFAALLAPLVGLSPAAGFLTAGINQILTLIGQGALALAISLRHDRAEGR